LTSFIANAFTFTLGFGMLTGGAVRFRLYGGFGIEPARIVAVGVLATLTFWLGVGAAAGLGLLLAPAPLPPLAGPRRALGPAIGAALLGAILAWVGVAAWRPRSIRVGGRVMRLPGAGMTTGAIAVGLVDTAAAALAFYALLPADAHVGFVQVLTVFAVA